MATFLQLKTRTYDVFRDTGQTFVTPTMVGSWINEAYLEVNARLGILRKSAADTFDANGKDTLPADFIRATNIYVTTATNVTEQLQIVDDNRFLAWKTSGSTPGALIGRIFGGSIETWPAQVSKAYTMEYVYKPVVLSADGDVPALPEELHVRLQNYARGMAYMAENDEQMSSVYMAMYEAGMPNIAPTAITRDNPGPLNFVPGASYWDEP